MTDGLRIINGRVYDPANQIDGEVREVCVQAGRIVASLPPEARTIDASGLIVMPGGVDIHAHIAGPKVNLARRLMPEDHRRDPHARVGGRRAGAGGVVPSTYATGYRYSLLGYTTVMEAAVAPLHARQVIAELHDTPLIDKAFFILMGNNLLLYQLIKAGRLAELRQAVAWWLNAARAYTIKVVNPGGVEMWKHGNRNVTGLDEEVGGLGVTPRGIISALAAAANDLHLPHPLHLHGNNLGHSGNFQTTLDTLRTLDGRRAHLAHIQFHSYGGELGGQPTSQAPAIAEYLNTHPSLSADVGQVMFGQAATMTADAPLSYMLYQITGDRWANADVELESGCGVVPFVYQDHNYVHALQWGLGLELFLLSGDPWRLVLSTDHPNGGSFRNYPRLIRLLMDRTFRNEQIKAVNQAAMRQTTLLDDHAREYTLNEIAIITRAGPARLLGLKDKGHLGVGADADLTLYAEQADKEAMFSAPRYVLKGGEIVIENEEFRAEPRGRLLHVAPPYDPAISATLRPFFDAHYSLRFENYPVAEQDLQAHQLVELD